MAWLVVLCGELGLDGLMYMPAGYFVATFGSRFIDPVRQARLEAMRRALAGLRLVEATRAVEEGRVVNAATGERAVGAGPDGHPGLAPAPRARRRGRVRGGPGVGALHAVVSASTSRKVTWMRDSLRVVQTDACPREARLPVVGLLAFCLRRFPCGGGARGRPGGCCLPGRSGWPSSTRRCPTLRIAGTARWSGSSITSSLSIPARSPPTTPRATMPGSCR